MAMNKKQFRKKERDLDTSFKLLVAVAIAIALIFSSCKTTKYRVVYKTGKHSRWYRSSTKALNAADSTTRHYIEIKNFKFKLIK